MASSFEASPKKIQFNELYDNSLYCKFVLILSIISVSFLFGYQFTCLNPLVPVLKVVYNETYLERYGEPIPDSTWNLLLSLTFSMLLGGAFVGSLLLNPVLSIFTRKQVMVLLHTFTVVGTLVMAVGGGLTGSYEAVITGRFIVGFTLGFGVNILSLILAETSVYHRQTFYNSFIGIVLALSDLSGPCIAHPKVLGTLTLWPVMLSITMIPSVIYLCCSYWLPETPFSVLRRRGRRDAKKVLEKLRTTHKDENLNECLESELEKIEYEQNGESGFVDGQNNGLKVQIKQNYASLKDIIQTKQYRLQLFAVVSLYSFEMLCGANNVFMYSDQIFTQANIPTDKVTYATIGGLATMVLGANIGTFLISRHGEKRVLMGMSTLMAISLVLITISLSTYHLIPSMSYVSVVGAVLMFFSFAGGPNVTIWSLGVALTTELSRPNILRVSGASMWFFGWFVSFILPYLYVSLKAYSLLIWLGCTVLFMLYCGFFIPNTKGKTPEQIQSFFN